MGDRVVSQYSLSSAVLLLSLRPNPRVRLGSRSPRNDYVVRGATTKPRTLLTEDREVVGLKWVRKAPSSDKETDDMCGGETVAQHLFGSTKVSASSQHIVYDPNSGRFWVADRLVYCEASLIS